MKTKPYEVLANVLFFVAVRLSRGATWVYRLGHRCWRKHSPLCPADSPWEDESQKVYSWDEHLTELAPEPTPWGPLPPKRKIAKKRRPRRKKK